MAQKKKTASRAYAAAFIAMGAALVLYSLIFKLYRWQHYVIAAAVALLTRRDAPAHAFYQRNGFADAEWRAWMTRPCQEDM